MKVVTVVGARPQFVKAAVLSRAMQQHGVEEILVHTGQHYDPNMSALFFTELGIPQPQHNLRVGSGTHGAQTGRALEAIERVLIDARPAWVLVFGDTNSTLAGALAASKLHIPVAHVEAGLRAFNRRMPEELNRLLTDHASDLLFAPTAAAVENLRREGVPAERVHLVGDVMFDAARHFGQQAEQQSRILGRLGARPTGYILATVHRAENTESPERLRAIMGALMQASREIPVLLPLHPRTRKALARQGLLAEAQKRLQITEPLGYLDMVMLEKNARLIATDSGGVQKEAFFHQVPCVTLRDETEWTELVTLGWNRLVPPVTEAAVLHGIRLAMGPAKRDEAARPYGEGRTAEAIVRALQALPA